MAITDKLRWHPPNTRRPPPVVGSNPTALTVTSFGLPSGPGIFMWPVRSVTKYRPSMIGLVTEGPDYLVGGAFGAIDFARDDAGEKINVMVST